MSNTVVIITCEYYSLVKLWWITYPAVNTEFDSVGKKAFSDLVTWFIAESYKKLEMVVIFTVGRDTSRPDIIA